MAPTAWRDGSSTSAGRRSPHSPPSPRESWTSGSAGSPLTPSGLRELAARHGIRPKKSRGQHFLIEPALARRIVELAEVGPGSRVVEVGPGLGSLTVALADSGARVVAVEVDGSLVTALADVVGGRPNVEVIHADALRLDWSEVLEGAPWTLVANLPYNVAVPVVMDVLEREPRVERLLVMVQREVGERLAAAPGHPQFAAVSLRVAYRAEARTLRRVPASVFWPRPKVESVLVSMRRRPPPVSVPEDVLWRVVREAFAQRRKNLRGAMIRLGLDPAAAADVLASCGVSADARPEQLGLEAFACLARALIARDQPR